MVQRKQTLFLAGVFILSGLTIFIPFQHITLANKDLAISLTSGFYDDRVNNNIYIPLVFDILSLVASIFIIFQFKKRVLQYKLSVFLTLLNTIVAGLFFLLPYVKEETIEGIHFSIGAFLPIIGIVCAFLAAHFIKKDEELVRSADRIR